MIVDVMELFEPGTRVSLGADFGLLNTVPAIIVGIVIRTGRQVLYEVAYWNNGAREEKLVTEDEVRRPGPDEFRPNRHLSKLKIGFAPA
jgi:hypothetical protein